MSTTTRERIPNLCPTTTRASSWRASSVCPCRPISNPMSSSSGSSPRTSTYIVPSSRPGSTLAMIPMRLSRPSRNSAATSPCSSSSSSESSSRRRLGRTITTASWDPMPSRPWRGSWTTWTSTSCSPKPSSPRAASIACSTLGALLRISSIVASLLRLGTGPGPRCAGLAPAASGLAPAASGLAPSAARLACTARPTTPLLLHPFHHARQEALLPRLALVVGRGGKGLGRRPGLEHEVLLSDLPRVRRCPVQDQTGREEDPEDAEHDRHHLQQRLLLLRRRPWRTGFLHLPPLEEGP